MAKMSVTLQIIDQVYSIQLKQRENKTFAFAFKAIDFAVHFIDF